MKDFLLICDKNCATYKEVFPLFKQGIVSFGSPVKEYEGTDRKFGNHGWITTFPVHNKKKLVLTATYDPELYPKYDNYDAIEVSRIKNIPYDYEGVMGVPITILDYDLDDVEIVGSGTADCLPEGYSGMTKEFVDLYYSQGNTGSYKEGNRLEHYIKDGKAIIPYARVLIKKNFEIDGLFCDSRADGYGLVNGTPTYVNEGHPKWQGPVLDGKPKYARILIKKHTHKDEIQHKRQKNVDEDAFSYA